MMEWKVTPEYINENWTEELLTLLFISRAKRYKRQSAMQKGQPFHSSSPDSLPVVSNEELFQMFGYEVEDVGRA